MYPSFPPALRLLAHPSLTRAVALLVVLMALPGRPSAAQAPFSDGQAAASIIGSASFTSLLSAASLNSPVAVAVDATSGKVYVADQLNHRVLRYGSLAAIQNAQPAERVFGQPDFGSNLANRGGTPGASTLNRPHGIAVDGAGRLYVADVGNQRVLRFDDASTGTSSGPAANRVFGQGDFAASTANRGGSVGANTLDTPLGVATDQAGRLYVADQYNHRVLRFDDAATGTSPGPAASRVFGQYDFVSNLENGLLPELVATMGPGPNTLRLPAAVALDGAGRLYVADQMNHRVLRFDNAGTGTSSAPDANRVFGQADFSGGGMNRYGSVGTATLSSPSFVAVDHVGRLYVADAGSNRVLRYDNAGTNSDNGPHASRVFGQPGFTTDAPNRAASNVEANMLSFPNGVAVDAEGRLYVADQNNHRVLRYDDAGTSTSSGPSAARVLGHAFLTMGQANQVSGGISGIGDVAAVAVDAARGKVYVADQSNNRVLRYGSLAALQNGQPAERVFGQPDFVSASINWNGFPGVNTLYRPSGVAVDAAGRLYVADYNNNRVLRFDDAGTGTGHMPSASRVFGQPDFVTNSPNRGALGSPGVNTMAFPNAVAVDGAGRLYVADVSNNRVLRFDDASTGTSSGPDANRVFGQADFIRGVANRGGSPNANTLGAPRGLAIDDMGRLYVADIGNHRVLRFDNAGTGTTNGPDANRVFGQADFASSSGNRGGGVAATTMVEPQAVALDGTGRLYVADRGNNRVLRFDAPGTGATNGPAASGVLGQSNYTSGSLNRGGNPAANTLSLPVAVAVDNATGQLLVGDTGNGRVLAYTSSAALPVELVSFTATADGTSARLAWTTASETSNAGFILETLRGAAWRELAFVTGRGTTTERSPYAYTVSDLGVGTHRFRLRQVDLDGATSYSPAVEVLVRLEAGSLVEVRGTSVRFAVRESQAVRADVYNVLGQQIATLFDGEAQAGQTTALVVPTGLASGVYLVRLTGRLFTETARVLVR